MSHPVPLIARTSSRTEPALGRDAELLLLGEALDRVTRGEGGVLELTGDPGMGKTRMLAELRRQAQQRHIVTMCGRATSTASVPFQLFVELLDDPLHLWPGPPPFPAGTAEILQRLWRTTDGAPVHEGEDPPRFQVIRALRRLLAELSTDGLVVVLDDMHNADPASLEMLDCLLRQPVPTPLLVAVSYRPRQAPQRLRAAFVAAEDGLVQRIELGPLAPAASADLLSRRGCTRSTDEVYRVSDGIPLYLTVLAGTDVPATEPLGGPALALPELDALTGNESRVLTAAAVIGETFDLDSLVAVSELDQSTVAAAIPVLLHGDLIRPVRDSPALMFRHGLVRQAVYGQCEPAARLGMHRRALAWLTRIGAPAPQRAQHVVRSARSWSAEDHAVLRDAATSAMRSAPAQATTWLTAALDLLPDTAVTHRERAELRLALALALRFQGAFRRSRDVLRDMLRDSGSGTGHGAAHGSGEPSGELPDRRALLGQYATAERLLGRYPEVVALVRRELAATPDRADDSEAQAHLRTELAVTTLLLGCVPEALREARLAADAAVRGLPRARATALIALAAALGGDAGSAIEAVDETMAIVDALSDAELSDDGEVLAWLGWAELLVDRMPDAERHLARGEATAVRTGRRHALVEHLLGRVWWALRAGDVPVAARLAARAQAVARESERPELLVAAVVAGTATAVWARPVEDLTPARTAARVAVSTLRGGDDLLSGAIGTVLAHVALADGDTVEYLQIMRRIGGADLAALAAVLAPRELECLVEASLDRGDETAAVTYAEHARRYVEQETLAGQRGYARRLLAARYATEGEHAAAIEELSAAVLDFTAAGMRLDEVRTNIALALQLRRSGRTHEGLSIVEQVERGGSVTGSPRLAAQVAAARARFGGSQRDVPDVFAVLTEREREVALLVGSGGTSRQIGDRLHLSARTVESHLTHIYQKLNVPSRAALVRLVERIRGAEFIDG